jgi:hypothetical protein
MGINSFPPAGGAGGYEFPSELIDPVSKFRISQPENLIDTDFEYGLQPTKWETVELINNTPSFFSKSGDTTIDGISSIITNAGTREIIVKTELDHGLAVGIPLNVTGTKSITADGSYIINSIPDTKTFTYLCKDDQPETASILDLYSSIITGEFFQGSQLRVSDSDGIVTDGAGTSSLTVTTNSTHGFGKGTPFYFLNLNSTVAQEFQAANTAARSFDASNSATAQSFDGSNTLSSFNIDWSNSATEGGVISNITSTDTANSRITVAHTTENFAGRPVGTPLYYNISAVSGYFNANPRGVVFLKTTTSLGTSNSTFQVSLVPDGEPVLFTTALTGTFQIANQARTFAGNNIDPVSQYPLNVFEDAPIPFDGANDQGAVLTANSFSGTSVQMTNNAGSTVGPSLYPGAMVLYTTTGTPPAPLVSGTTYFINTIALVGGQQGVVSVSLRNLPEVSSPAITFTTAGSGTQTFRKIGVSLDRDILHIPGHNYAIGEMLKYQYPSGGAMARQAYTSDYMYVERVYDEYNITLKSTKGSAPTGLTVDSPGVSAEQLKADWGYNTDGVYFILVNGVSTPIFCIMNSAINGGGWMMAMKATRGTTFNFDASFWETNNTLNPTQTNRNDGDAKFNTYNFSQSKDLLALWPDIGQGGSISVSGYPWIWLQNNYNGGTRQTLLSFFQTAGFRSGQAQTFGGNGRFIQDAKTFSGWASGVFSSQVDIRFYGFNYQAYNSVNGFARVRWGFGWNENGDQLYPSVNNPAPGSNDVSGGIGMHTSFGATGGYSAGDHINCCQDTTGINRSARVEIYVR